MTSQIMLEQRSNKKIVWDACRGGFRFHLPNPILSFLVLFLSGHWSFLGLDGLDASLDKMFERPSNRVSNTTFTDFAGHFAT